MSQRKHDVTKIVDRDYPHQVAIQVPRGGLALQLMDMHAFCAQRRVPYRTVAERQEIGDFIRFAFSNPTQANAFAGQFGGEQVTKDNASKDNGNARPKRANASSS